MPEGTRNSSGVRITGSVILESKLMDAMRGHEFENSQEAFRVLDIPFMTPCYWTKCKHEFKNSQEAIRDLGIPFITPYCWAVRGQESKNSQEGIKDLDIPLMPLCCWGMRWLVQWSQW